MTAKGPNRKSRGPMKQYGAGSPFERIAMDICGPFPLSKCVNKYVLVDMGYFSKWPEVYPIPNQEATTIADVFVKSWVSRFGTPVELHSDQGRNFESAVFQEMCKLLGIHKTRTTPLHPQSDGMVERFNRTLDDYLRKIVCDDQRDWDSHIPLFLMAYRSAVHETTGQTPAKIVFGSDLRLPVDLKFGSKLETKEANGNYVSNLQDKLILVHDHVRQRSKIVSDRVKVRYDKIINSEGFNEDDLVLLYNPQRRKGLSPKLQCNWEGPYKIVNRINDVVYRIRSCQTKRSKMKVVHLERLAKYGSGVVPDRDDQA